MPHRATIRNVAFYFKREIEVEFPISPLTALVRKMRIPYRADQVLVSLANECSRWNVSLIILQATSCSIIHHIHENHGHGPLRGIIPQSTWKEIPPPSPPPHFHPHTPTHTEKITLAVYYLELHLDSTVAIISQFYALIMWIDRRPLSATICILC